MSATDTIHKLLAIAEDPAASPHEREVAANRAARLMARHAITSLDLNTAHTEEITTTSIFVPGDTSTALVLRTKEQRLQDHMNSLNLGAPKHLTVDPAGVADGHDDGWASGLGSPTDKTLKDLNPNLITQ